MSDHTTVLPSSSDDDVTLPEYSSVELRVWPRGDEPVGVDEVTGVLRVRRVVAVVRDGSGDGCVVVNLAARDDERVVVSADGELQPGPPFEEVARELAHGTGCDVLVDGVVVVTADGTHRMVDDLPVRPEIARTLLAWRASTASPMVVRSLAQTLGAPVEHATVDGWTVVALEDEAVFLSLEDLPLGGGDLPVVELARRGHERSVRWGDRARLASVTAALDDAAGTPASRLAAELGDTGYRSVPRAGRVDAGTRAALDQLPLVPETLLSDAADALGLPAGLAELVEGAAPSAPGAPSRWLTAAGTSLVEPGRSAGGAITRGMYAILTEEPQGDGRYARFRRWLWHRPRVLVAISLVEAGFGAVGVAAGLAGATVAGHGWPVWTVAGLLLVDGVPDLVTGVMILRSRRASRDHPSV